MPGAVLATGTGRVSPVGTVRAVGRWSPSGRETLSRMEPIERSGQPDPSMGPREHPVTQAGGVSATSPSAKPWPRHEFVGGNKELPPRVASHGFWRDRPPMLPPARLKPPSFPSPDFRGRRWSGRKAGGVGGGCGTGREQQLAFPAAPAEPLFKGVKS